MSIKKYFITMLISFFILTTNSYALDIDINSDNVLLYNLKDKEIIYEKNSDKNTYIASLTKIVTVLVALENIKDINEEVTLTEEVFIGLLEADASVAGFNLGDIVTYEDLLYGSMLPSGADATNALALNLFGSNEKFVKEMNKLMTKLNIKSTHFTNTSGLDEEGQKATLKDLLTIILYAFENEEFIKIFNTGYYTTKSTNLTMRNTLNYYKNKWDLNTDIIKGSKTGYTDLAGLCLLSYATSNNIDLLLITTMADVDEERYPYNVTDALNIYNYYFDNYSYQNILNKDERVTNINNKYYKRKKIDLITKKEFQYLLPNNYNEKELKFNYDIKNNINFLTNIKKPVGTLTIEYQNKEIYIDKLYLNERVNFSILTYIIYHYKVITSLLIIILILKRKKKI